MQSRSTSVSIISTVSRKMKMLFISLWICLHQYLHLYLVVEAAQNRTERQIERESGLQCEPERKDSKDVGEDEDTKSKEQQQEQHKRTRRGARRHKTETEKVHLPDAHLNVDTNAFLPGEGEQSLSHSLSQSPSLSHQSISNATPTATTTAAATAPPIPMSMPIPLKSSRQPTIIEKLGLCTPSPVSSSTPIALASLSSPSTPMPSTPIPSTPTLLARGDLSSPSQETKVSQGEEIAELDLTSLPSPSPIAISIARGDLSLPVPAQGKKASQKVEKEASSSSSASQKIRKKASSSPLTSGTSSHQIDITELDRLGQPSPPPGIWTSLPSPSHGPPPGLWKIKKEEELTAKSIGVDIDYSGESKSGLLERDVYPNPTVTEEVAPQTEVTERVDPNRIEVDPNSTHNPMHFPAYVPVSGVDYSPVSGVAKQIQVQHPKQIPVQHSSTRSDLEHHLPHTHSHTQSHSQSQTEIHHHMTTIEQTIIALNEELKCAVNFLLDEDSQTQEGKHEGNREENEEENHEKEKAIAGNTSIDSASARASVNSIKARNRRDTRNRDSINSREYLPNVNQEETRGSTSNDNSRSSSYAEWVSHNIRTLEQQISVLQQYGIRVSAAEFIEKLEALLMVLVQRGLWNGECDFPHGIGSVLGLNGFGNGAVFRVGGSASSAGSASPAYMGSIGSFACGSTSAPSYARSAPPYVGTSTAPGLSSPLAASSGWSLNTIEAPPGLSDIAVDAPPGLAPTTLDTPPSLSPITAKTSSGLQDSPALDTPPGLTPKPKANMSIPSSSSGGGGGDGSIPIPPGLNHVPLSPPEGLASMSNSNEEENQEQDLQRKGLLDMLEMLHLMKADVSDVSVSSDKDLLKVAAVYSALIENSSGPLIENSSGLENPDEESNTTSSNTTSSLSLFDARSYFLDRLGNIDKAIDKVVGWDKGTIKLDGIEDTHETHEKRENIGFRAESTIRSRTGMTHLKLESLDSSLYDSSSDSEVSSSPSYREARANGDMPVPYLWKMDSPASSVVNDSMDHSPLFDHSPLSDHSPHGENRSLNEAVDDVAIDDVFVDRDRVGTTRNRVGTPRDRVSVDKGGFNGTREVGDSSGKALFDSPEKTSQSISLSSESGLGLPSTAQEKSSQKKPASSKRKAGRTNVGK